MTLSMHPAYERLVETAVRSHENNRSPAGITAEDVVLARLYCYAFRLHVIGAFHAARVAVASRPEAASVHRKSALDALNDLANQSMDPVPADFRAVIAVFYRYHRGIERVLECLERDGQESQDAEIGRVRQRFGKTIEEITGGNGIHLTQDTVAPEQASFLVPNLGIVIVPLVYGDYHSWNLAYLAGDVQHVPTHWHHDGVEIHLGYNPTHGVTVLGEGRCPVEEGYAKPIPPKTDHGWINTGDEIHHVPFIFGSLKHGGWGVFFDVEVSEHPVEELPMVDREAGPFRHMVYLEREIARAEAEPATGR